MRAWLCIVLLAACGGRSSGPTLHAGEGFVPVDGGRVWYRIVGEGDGTPILVLHGGPGVPSDYLKPLAALAQDRPVVFYDQLGTGKSDHPADTTLWHIERYLRELQQVRTALGLERVHLYGHSWGAVLAAEHVLSGANGVQSLTLGGVLFDGPRLRRDEDSLIGTLPAPVARELRRNAASPGAPTPAFQAAYITYLRTFYARRQPWSTELQDSVLPRIDQSSARVMRRYLDTYNRVDRLGDIAVPTLFLVGRYDITTPPATREYQQRVAGSRMIVFDSSGHLPMQDEPDGYVQAIRDFLRDVESRGAN